MNRFLKYIYSLVFALLTFNPVTAQFFVDEDTPCPRGTDVKADTITFATDKAMPFDRCFYLKFTIKGEPKIVRFAVNPIDREGKLKIRRRDYRVAYKSGFENRKQRRSSKKNEPFKEFKENSLFRLFKGISTTKKGKNTEVILNVPPLDPNREYRIILIGQDQESLKEIYTIGEMIFKSESSSTTPATVTTLRSESVKKYENNIITRIRRKPPFEVKSFATLKNYLAKFTLEFNQDTTTKVLLNGTEKKRARLEEYRIFLTPVGISPPSVANILANKYFITYYPDSLLIRKMKLLKLITLPKREKVSITLPIIDTYGNPIIPYNSSNYQIHLLSLIRKDPFSKDTLATPEILNYIKLGVLDIPKDGIQYKFTSDRASLDKDIVVNAGTLSEYSKIEMYSISVNSLANIIYFCFCPEHLQYLMEKALIFPGVQNAVKDLTLKDDLTRTISILFEQQPDIIKDIKHGLISFKDPILRTEITNFTGRKTNVDASVMQIGSLEEFAKEVISADGSKAPKDLMNLLVCLKEFREELEAVAKLLEISIEHEDKIKNELVTNFRFWEVVPASSLNSTSLLEFVNEAKFRIVPDFGFITTFRGDNSLHLKDLTPFLGFNINFRPIDKNIPLRLVRYKSWRHRLSFTSGITLSPLKIENRREDIFEKSTLITGFGFRFTNYIKLTSGAAWFKAIDPNLLSNDKPIRFSPYVGVSFDLEIQDLLGGISKLIK